MNKDLQKLYTYLQKAITPPATSYTLSPTEITILLNELDKLKELRDFMDSIQNVIGSNYSLKKIDEILRK